jgi:hypothetical protein
MQSLEEIINKVFETNIMKKERTRSLVEARMVYAKIIRDRGNTLKSIGEYLSKDHTTIIHYITQIESLMKQDERLLNNYIKASELFLQDKEVPVENLTVKNLHLKIESLNIQLEHLITERSKVLQINNKNRRFRHIVELLNERVKEGEEKKILKKINNMLNGFEYEYDY